MDKQKRTWVSNLAAVEISSSADFQQMLHLVSSRCHPSASSSALSHPSHASSPTCIITLLVTADVPTASMPSSVQQRIPNLTATQSPSPSRIAVQSPTTRLCSKLSFVEVGSSTLPIQASPVRTVSAGQGLTPIAPQQLGRGSSGVSMASSRSRRSTLGDRPLGPPSGVGGTRGSVAGGRNAKSQVSSTEKRRFVLLCIVLLSFFCCKKLCVRPYIGRFILMPTFFHVFCFLAYDRLRPSVYMATSWERIGDCIAVLELFVCIDMSEL